MGGTAAAAVSNPAAVVGSRSHKTAQVVQEHSANCKVKASQKVNCIKRPLLLTTALSCRLIADTIDRVAA